jgi:hypothetical protein
LINLHNSLSNSDQTICNRCQANFLPIMIPLSATNFLSTGYLSEWFFRVLDGVCPLLIAS